MEVQIAIIMLAVNAAWVAVRQFRHGDRKAGLTWVLIVGYWVLLTIKNGLDFIASVR